MPDVRLFIGNLFFLGSTAIIIVVSHRIGGVARRRDFLQRVALEEAGRHRDEFLANVTHELRTPLAAILGFCDMLADYMPDASSEHRNWLARIRGNALTLYRLIVQLLDFSKLEAGAMSLRTDPVAIEPIVGKVAADMRAIAGPEGSAVEVALPADAARGGGRRGADRGDRHESRGKRAQVFRAGARSRSPRRAAPSTSPWDRIVPDPGPERARRRTPRSPSSTTATAFRKRISDGSSSRSGSSTAHRRAGKAAPASVSRSARGSRPR